MAPPLALSRRHQFHYLAPATYTVESGERKGSGIKSTRYRVDLSQVTVKTREIGKFLTYRLTLSRRPRPDRRPALYANGRGHAAVPIGTA